VTRDQRADPRPRSNRRAAGMARQRRTACRPVRLSEGLGALLALCYRPRRYSSRNCHVLAPSKRRTRTEAMSSGSKLPRFTPCLAPGSAVKGSQ
jgi:hypothetical protein